jgi:hypothetical protein
VRARGVEKLPASTSLQVERLGKHSLHLLPTFRGDRSLPPAAELAPQPQFR